MKIAYIVNVKQLIQTSPFIKKYFNSNFEFQHKEDAIAFAELLNKTTDPCKVQVFEFVEDEKSTKIYDNNE